MKKNYFLSLNLFLITSFTFLHAQVVNGDFEVIKTNGKVSNWGKNFSYNVGLNTETGESTSDVIQYTNNIPSLSYPSFGNSHSGQYALEMANAFNVTQNEIIVGGAVLFEDASQDMPPGGNYNINTSFLPFNASLFNSSYGYNLGFYYKFSPLGNDIAEAILELFDSEQNSVGKVSVPISGVNTDFNYVYASLDMTSTNTPVFMSLSFSMAKEGSTPTMGSTLVVDDVFINSMTLGNVINQVSQYSVYPTLVDDIINIVPSSEAIGKINYKIITTQGQIVKESNVENNSNNVYTMNVNELSSGIYFLKIESGSQNVLKKFIKK